MERWHLIGGSIGMSLAEGAVLHAGCRAVVIDLSDGDVLSATRAYTCVRGG
jgi:hypothetical protein